MVLTKFSIRLLEKLLVLTIIIYHHRSLTSASGLDAYKKSNKSVLSSVSVLIMYDTEVKYLLYVNSLIRCIYTYIYISGVLFFDMLLIMYH